MLRSVMEKAGAEELVKMKEALDERMRQCMPVMMQLPGMEAERETIESGFLI